MGMGIQGNIPQQHVETPQQQKVDSDQDQKEKKQEVAEEVKPQKSSVILSGLGKITVSVESSSLSESEITSVTDMSKIKGKIQMLAKTHSFGQADSITFDVKPSGSVEVKFSNEDIPKLKANLEEKIAAKNILESEKDIAKLQQEADNGGILNRGALEGLQEKVAEIRQKYPNLPKSEELKNNPELAKSDLKSMESQLRRMNYKLKLVNDIKAQFSEKVLHKETVPQEESRGDGHVAEKRTISDTHSDKSHESAPKRQRTETTRESKTKSGPQQLKRLREMAEAPGGYEPMPASKKAKTETTADTKQTIKPSEVQADVKAETVAPKELSKTEITRGRVLDEIVSSEESYHEGVKLGCELLKGMLEITHPNMSDADRMKTTLGHALNDLQQVRESGELILAKFREARGNENLKNLDPKTLNQVTKNMADVYSSKEFGEYGRLMSKFVMNYDQLSKLLVKLESSNKMVASYIQACKAETRFKSKGPLDYCITPVQRMPRHELLIRDTMKHTPPGQELDSLNDGAKIIKSSADKINTQRAVAEETDFLDGMASDAKFLSATDMAGELQKCLSGEHRLTQSSSRDLFAQLMGQYAAKDPARAAQSFKLLFQNLEKMRNGEPSENAAYTNLMNGLKNHSEVIQMFESSIAAIEQPITSKADEKLFGFLNVRGGLRFDLAYINAQMQDLKALLRSA
jgi:hypothetical protein